MELILVAPDLDRKIRMEVDMLDYVTEGVWSIEYSDGKCMPLAYLSISQWDREEL